MSSAARINGHTGFVRDNGDAMGRPVGVVLDAQGGLLVADDVGNAIWRVTGESAAKTAESKPHP
jgi:glucose/arabinose dehydrogenase